MAEPIAEVGYLAGLCGHTGTDWQKLQMLWGYYDTISEAVVDTELVAGTNILYGTAVPVGEVWVVTTVAGRYDGAVATALYTGCTVGGVAVNTVSAVPPTSAVWYPAIGQFVLKEGDKAHCFILDAAAGDDGYLRYCGYKMRLDL